MTVQGKHCGWLLAGWGLLAGLAAGCGGLPPDRPDPPEMIHIKKAFRLCMECKLAKQKLPDSIAEVKEWAVAAGKAKDEDFVSTRDGKPYSLARSAEMLGLLMVYEQTGEGGRRYVVNMGGRASAMSAEEVQKAVANMPKVPAGYRGKG